MPSRQLVATIVAVFVALLVAAPMALADTCCANTAVTFAPRAAEPGDVVRVHGLACLDADNSGPLALNLVSFWLSTDDIPADPSPGDAPGSPNVHLADDLPSVGAWLPFKDVSGSGLSATGSASLVVPDLHRGTYQLWWLCDNGGGPGSGIHYSGGPRLNVAGPPDTSTTSPVEAADSQAGVWQAAFLVLVAMVALLGTMRREHRKPAPST